jgi:hypothetical protein
MTNDSMLKFLLLDVNTSRANRCQGFDQTANSGNHCDFIIQLVDRGTNTNTSSTSGDR